MTQRTQRLYLYGTFVPGSWPFLFTFIQVQRSNTSLWRNSRQVQRNKSRKLFDYHRDGQSPGCASKNPRHAGDIATSRTLVERPDS